MLKITVKEIKMISFHQIDAGAAASYLSGCDHVFHLKKNKRDRRL